MAPEGTDSLGQRVSEYMRALTTFPDRHVGGPGNHAATALFAAAVDGFGFDVARREFACLEWEPGAAHIDVGDERFELQVGPYSSPLDTEAVLVAVSSVEELESEAVRGAIVLFHGPIAAAQVMPRNFTFYNPESHRRIIRALDEFAPAAVLAATGRDPEMVGGQYPFPLFEDGDLGVPSAYLTDVEGERLMLHDGVVARLRIDSERIPASAEHVVATLPGRGEGRIVISAHIDSRKGSPGALDNASGVATVLAAAELLTGYSGGPTLEFVPFNGEDYYANPGEMMWLADNRERLDDIALMINIDDSGQVGTVDHVSFYDCPPDVDRAVRSRMEPYDRIAEGPKWYQGDHMMLVQQGCPAIAIASSDMVGFMARYAHSERDSVELADFGLIAEAARFVADVVMAVGDDR